MSAINARHVAQGASAEGTVGGEVVVAVAINPLAIEVGTLSGRTRRTFCFLRLQLSHALAVRCLLSGSTFGRVMVGGGGKVSQLYRSFRSDQLSMIHSQRPSQVKQGSIEEEDDGREVCICAGREQQVVA